MAEELPKKRRPSLGNLQAIKAKRLLQPVQRNDGSTYTKELFTFSKFILTLNEGIFNKTIVKMHENMEEDIEMVSGDLECVAVICLFSLGQGSGHFVPFVRIEGTWYNGDNEIGFLRKRQNPPTRFMQYKNPDIHSSHSTNFASDIICFYADPSLFTRGRGALDGSLVFGQTDKTCGPDALQTVLMFADGFYEYYTMSIYSKLKALFPSRRPRNMRELKGNIQAFDKKKYVALLSNDNVVPETRRYILFLLLMFSRYKQIELLDERPGEDFEVLPNSEVNLTSEEYNYEKFKSKYTTRFNPLYEAVLQRKVDDVKVFLEHGENPNVREGTTDTPLLRAVSMGYTEIVRLLLTYKDLDLNAPSMAVFAGYTPLMIASKNMNMEIVDILCKGGANLDKTDVHGITALIIAAKHENAEIQQNVEIVDILCKGGANLDKTNMYGMTALMFACNNLNVKIVEILCKSGADVNKTDVDGKTALMIISSKRRGFNNEILPIVDTLLKRGADAKILDDRRETAYGYSQFQANRQLMDILSPLTEMQGGSRQRTRRQRPNRRL